AAASEQALAHGHPLGRSHGALAGAGDLRSCANDLVRFARLGLGEGPTDLVEATRVALSTRLDIGDGSQQALGWRIWRLRGDEWPGHGGSSAGCRSGISLHRRTRTAIVALGSGRRRQLGWFDSLVPELWRSLQAAGGRRPLA